tara:strand:- start:43 stop:441 length:399 start_codon:yes stop_codon:yes gene_type:complete
MKKIIIIVLILLAGGIIGYLIPTNVDSVDQELIVGNSFENLNTDEMYQQIIENRDFAIAQAKANGDYRCCISPDCTMCYMEANQWNNHQAGTCACDDFIAKGEDPCPQCKKGLVVDTGTSCQITSRECDISN